MKKVIYSFLVLLFCATGVFANVITTAVGQTVAANYFRENAGIVVNAIALTYTETSPAGEPVYFVYDINGGKGFVIVVADDALSPVIGYSTEGAYVVPPAGSNAGYWMEERKQEIIADRAQQLPATTEIASQWSTYINNRTISKRTSVVTPLVQTSWDQPSPYNALCPGGSVTGCVATAMAQIMRYWSYPLKGIGSSSYNSSYGTLSANYGNTTYNWTNMPTGKVTSANADVATIMYQCGVSVDMDYSPSGSGAYVTTYDNSGVCAQISYTKYFGYNASTIKGLQQFNYTDAKWIVLIETDLDSNRPVQYVGYDPTYGGHTWVCDGYDASNNFHMNWGWSGSDNAYYSIGSLNPGGTYNFSSSHEVLVGIEPPAAFPNDAGILTVTSPTGTTCNPSITPVVRLENFGSSTLTSCVIHYYVDANAAQTYNWTGAVLTSQYLNVTLPALSVTSGNHSLTSYTTNPNNVTDGNTANDQSTISFTIASSPPSLPMSTGFEGSAFLPTGWSIWNPNSDASWQVVTTVGHTSTNSIGFNNCDGDGGADMTGLKDRFITLPFDFSNAPNASLSFDVAYAPVSYGSKLYSDTLAVYYSFDCGSTWTSCYVKGGVTLATAPTYNAGNPGCWSPSSTQWRTDVISLGSLTGHGSVMFAFENRSGFGGWVFVDNINLSNTTITDVASLNVAPSYLVYPNPVSSMFTVEGPGGNGNVRYSLYNIVGEELRGGIIATGGNHFVQTISVSDLAQGLYFLRLSDDEHVWTTRVDVR